MPDVAFTNVFIDLTSLVGEAFTKVDKIGGPVFVVMELYGLNGVLAVGVGLRAGRVNHIGIKSFFVGNNQRYIVIHIDVQGLFLGKSRKKVVSGEMFAFYLSPLEFLGSSIVSVK